MPVIEKLALTRGPRRSGPAAARAVASDSPSAAVEVATVVATCSPSCLRPAGASSEMATVVATCSPSCLRPAGAASAASINTRDFASVCRVAPPGERASYVLHAETQRAARESDSAASAPPAPAAVPEMPSPAPASGSILRPVALRAAAWPAAPSLPVTMGVVIGSIDIVGCAVPAGQAMVIRHHMSNPPRQALAAGQQGAIPQPSQLPAVEMQFLRYMQSMFPVPTPGQPTPPPPSQHRSPAPAPTPAPPPSAFKAFIKPSVQFQHESATVSESSTSSEMEIENSSME